MKDEPEQLLAAMRARHQAGEQFSSVKARLAEFGELPHLQLRQGSELLDLATKLAQLLATEIELNERLTAFAMGMAQAGAITSAELNVLMGLA
jgi:hypothetical protein